MECLSHCESRNVHWEKIREGKGWEGERGEKGEEEKEGRRERRQN